MCPSSVVSPGIDSMHYEPFELNDSKQINHARVPNVQEDYSFSVPDTHSAAAVPTTLQHFYSFNPDQSCYNLDDDIDDHMLSPESNL